MERERGLKGIGKRYEEGKGKEGALKRFSSGLNYVEIIKEYIQRRWEESWNKNERGRIERGGT